jgi:dTDP-4-dehydrorhamnose 3,5-epimerase-like enzyme
LYSKHKWLRTPKAACHYTYEILKELLVLIEIQRLEKDLIEQKELETFNSIVMQEKISSLEKQVQEKNSLCHNHWLELTDVKSKSLQINFLVKSLNSYDMLRKKITDYEKENKTYIEIDITHLSNEYLTQCIEIVQKEIQVLEQKQLKAKNTAHVVSLLEEELSSLEKKHELLKHACTELSPNKGLIAKGLKGFLDHFLPQVNSFIEQVWLYPMKVCVKESNEKGIELDYKFQVQVNDSKPADDISNVSKGMKEMINLAFRLASMPYLGLENSCVYLDEYGANLDSKHKLAAYKVIKNLMESKNYSQVYVVSHFADGYEVLDNADFTVLCGSNIEMPTKNINKTTLITYH